MQGVWKIPEPIEEGVGRKKISEPICIVEVVWGCERYMDPNRGRLWVTHVPMFRRGWGKIPQPMRVSRG